MSALRDPSAPRIAPTLPSPASGGGSGRGRGGRGDEVGRRDVESPLPTLRDWLGVLAMGTGLFMAIMDVQIVTSSLTQIQGGLSASPDEIAWVQTAYLVADVVMVPLSGMMSRLLSTRILFATAALGFTGANVLCATAPSPGESIRCRPMLGVRGARATALV